MAKCVECRKPGARTMTAFGEKHKRCLTALDRELRWRVAILKAKKRMDSVVKPKDN